MKNTDLDAELSLSVDTSISLRLTEEVNAAGGAHHMPPSFSTAVLPAEEACNEKDTIHTL